MEDTANRHYAVIDKYQSKLTLKYNGEIIAYSEQAFILKEVGFSVYNPVFYIPKEDLKIELEKETQRTSHCPIKGEATYWNLPGSLATDDYFAWSYEEPLPRAKKLKGYVAFNSDVVTFISEPMK